MKVYQLIAVLALVQGVRVKPHNVADVQLKSQSRVQSVIAANNQLFLQIHSHLEAAQKAAAKGDKEGADLNADQMNEVVDSVHERWLGSIDKEEPEIVDEFLRKMKDAVAEVHATEGFP